MDLGIISHECNQCGAVIYPHNSVSTKGEKIKVEKHPIPKPVENMLDEELMSQSLYNEIQAGVHDNILSLKRFKGKSRKNDVIDTLKAEHMSNRNIRLSEINTKETEIRAKAKSVTRTDTETEITFEAERHLATLEGDENIGQQKCPICGFVLVSWNK